MPTSDTGSIDSAEAEAQDAQRRKLLLDPNFDWDWLHKDRSKSIQGYDIHIDVIDDPNSEMHFKISIICNCRFEIATN
jgi:hypothetical protein